MAKDNSLGYLTPAIVVSMEDRTFHSINDLVFAVTETDEGTERDSVENRHAAIGALSQANGKIHPTVYH